MTTVKTRYNDPVATTIKAEALSKNDYFRLQGSATVYKTLKPDYREPRKDRRAVLILNLDVLDIDIVYIGQDVFLVDVNEITIDVDLSHDPV